MAAEDNDVGADEKPTSGGFSELDVAIAAARTAVAASKETGRPVHPRVKEIAEMDDPKPADCRV